MTGSREATFGRRGAGTASAIVGVALLALIVFASRASAEPLSLNFTEARANVGVQLSDAALFEAPDVAPFAGQVDPGSGAIAAGELTVPQFETFITDPVDANVAVDFEIGTIDGSFDSATGALTLSGTAGGTLTANGDECIVATVPAVLTLTSAGSSGGTSPRSGQAFTSGLTGAGAIAGQWTDMTATPVTPEDNAVCATVDERIGGPGGVWLVQEGDVDPPLAPQLTSTDPASPNLSGTPRILGSAEAGSTVRIYAGTICAGAPVGSGSAAELGSPGIAVTVAEGTTATFSATATDPAGNVSACSTPIYYRRLRTPPPPPCIVPKLIGRTLAWARTALKKANCELGKVRREKQQKIKRRGRYVVKWSNPAAGAQPLDRTVDVGLRWKPAMMRR